MAGDSNNVRKSVPQESRKRKRRSQYAQQACDDCRSRKVKCCGSFPCRRCSVRNIRCEYSGGGLDSHSASNNGCNSASQDAPSRPSSMIEGHHILQAESHSPNHNNNSVTQAHEFVPPNNPESNAAPIQSIQKSSYYSDNDTDTFELERCSQDPRNKQPLSLQAKLSDTHDSLSIHPLTPPSQFPTPVSQASQISRSKRQPAVVDLPSPQQLFQLLQVFYSEVNPYFPCIDQDYFEDQLLVILKARGYSNTHRSITIEQQEWRIMAMLCAVLALSVFFDPEDRFSENGSPRGWTWHLKARNLMLLCRSSITPEINAARVHLLDSIYLVHIERLGESCESLVLALAVAQATGLNNESSWPTCSAATSLQLRILWWIIYYQDRRVAEKLGRPYFIRDSEVDVQDFSTGAELGVQCRFSQSTLHYMQSLVEWGRAWGKVWDLFFSCNARKLGDREAVEATDRAILQLQASLHPRLSFEKKCIDENTYLLSGEDERKTRYRILCFTRYNMLRLVIRRNPLVESQEDIQSAEICTKIAQETAGSLCAYLAKYRVVRQLGLFVAVALVECVCHVVSALAETSQMRSPAKGCHESLIEVKRLLQDIAPRFDGACRALSVVEPLLVAAEHLLTERDRWSENWTWPPDDWFSGLWEQDTLNWMDAGYGYDVTGIASDRLMPHVLPLGPFDTDSDGTNK